MNRTENANKWVVLKLHKYVFFIPSIFLKRQDFNIHLLHKSFGFILIFCHNGNNLYLSSAMDWILSPQNSYFEAPMPNVTVFGDWVFMRELGGDKVRALNR